MALLLAIVVISAVGIWYQLEGHGILRPLFLSLFPPLDEAANGLLTLHFNIGAETYQTIDRQWREAVQQGILQLGDQNWLSAQVHFQGKTIPVRIWLKWDHIDRHQESKWPLQVKIQDEATVLGMRAFSIEPPATGRCLDEWLYVEELRRAGVLAPRYAFVNIFVNGEDWGIYALKEDLSRQWFESQGRQEGVVVRLNGNLFWGRWAWDGDLEYEGWNLFAHPLAMTSDLPAFAEVDELGADLIENDHSLSEQAVTALGLLRAFQSQQLMASAVFDVERMGRYIAHANLWGARQGATWHDEQYYYDPLTSQLEPIGYDALGAVPRSVHFSDLAQYDDPEIMRAYVREVLRISHPDYLKELRANYSQEIDRYRAALSQEFPASYLELPWSVLARRQVSLLSALHPPQTVHAYQGSAYQVGGVGLEVSNLLHYPVILRRLRIGEHAVDVRPDWVAEEDAALLHGEAMPAVVLRRTPGAIPEYVTLHVPAAAIQELMSQGSSLESDKLQLVTSLVGTEEPIVVDVQRDYPLALSAPVLPAQPSVEQALRRYPFLTVSDRPGFLELRAGTWPVEGDLVLPAGVGLFASESVTLTFDSGAVFLSSGPLLLYGPDGQGIHFVPKQEDWAGIAVLQAGPQIASQLANVEIRATTGIRREGWITAAGVTFYESAVVLRDCRLLESAAPAAIRIVRADFKFAHTEFANASLHAFDGDFVQGRVEQCSFHDILGNAIDVSGGQVAVYDVGLMRVYDRGISAGRDSVVTVQGLRVKEVGIAIASKDLSYVNARDVHIHQASVAGFAAYWGETGYGPASIQASQVVFEEDESVHALVQQECSVTLNGSPAVASEINVDEPYWRQGALGATHVLNYRLGPTIRLIGHSLSTGRLAPGDSIEFGLYWQALAKPPLDYTIFVHVLDAEGQNVAGWDTMPRQNTFPTTEWPVRRVIDDVHRVLLPPDLPPGEYRVALGMYYWPTGERLPVYGPDGDEVPDSRIILEQKVEVR
jgi:hypothetical protein